MGTNIMTISVSPENRGSVPTPEESIRRNTIIGIRGLIEAVQQNPELSFGDWQATPVGDNGANFTTGRYERKTDVTLTDMVSEVSLAMATERPHPRGVLVRNRHARIAPNWFLPFNDPGRLEERSARYQGVKSHDIAHDPGVLTLDDVWATMTAIADAKGTRPSRHPLIARFGLVSRLLSRA